MWLAFGHCCSMHFIYITLVIVYKLMAGDDNLLLYD